MVFCSHMYFLICKIELVFCSHMYNLLCNIELVFCSHMYLEDTLVVDQEVIEMLFTADIYYVVFDFDAVLDMTMLWGSRIKLTW